MEIPAAVASIEDVPNEKVSLRDLYAQNEEGVFLPQVKRTEMTVENRPRVYAIEDIGGLTATLNDLKDKRSSLQNKIEEYGDISALEAKNLKDKVDEFSQLDPEKEAEKLAKAKVEGQLSNMQQEFTTQLDKEKQFSTTLQSQLEDELINAQAIKAISDNNGSVELLLGVVRGRSRMVEKDGKFLPEVLDATGNPAFKHDGSQLRPMSIPELVRELKDNTAYGRAFDATDVSGSGPRSTDVKKSSDDNTPGTPPQVISIEDTNALGESLEALASGEITVDFGD